MSVTGVSNTQSTTNSSTNSTTSSSDPTAALNTNFNTFLQLLIAQMKNQDPTNPTDPSQYLTQYAQMSQVEQAIQTNSKLDSLLSSSALSQADGLIGRTASMTASDGSAVSGTITSVSIISGGAVATLSDGTQISLGPGVTFS